MSAQGPVRALTENSKADWQTPQPLFKWLDSIFGFDLDAAASEENALCSNYIGEEEDALRIPYWGVDRAAFCNPPYGNLLPWVERFSKESCTHRVVIVALLPANTDTRWFARCWETAAEIWFLTPRVSFVSAGKPVSGNTCGSMVVVWRPEPKGAEPRVRHFNWKTEAPE